MLGCPAKTPAQAQNEASPDVIMFSMFDPYLNPCDVLPKSVSTVSTCDVNSARFGKRYISLLQSGSSAKLVFFTGTENQKGRVRRRKRIEKKTVQKCTGSF